MTTIRRCAVLATVALALSLLSGAVLMGADHPKGPIPHNSGTKRPQAVTDLFNAPERVHGFWVNASDMFFYAGDTAKLNAFLEVYAGIDEITKRVILRVGPKTAGSPWDEKPRDIDADWSLHTGAWGLRSLKRDLGEGIMLDTEVEIWIGRSISLDELEIPDGLEVESGGEIDSFLEKRAVG